MTLDRQRRHSHAGAWERAGQGSRAARNGAGGGTVPSGQKQAHGRRNYVYILDYHLRRVNFRAEYQPAPEHSGVKRMGVGAYLEMRNAAEIQDNLCH